MWEMESMDVTKMDMHKGDLSSVFLKSNQDNFVTGEGEDDEDFDDDDHQAFSEEHADSKTQEGGLIMALINMQLKPRIKELFPSISKQFSDDSNESHELHCYGIHPYAPTLNYFDGGF